MADVNRRTPSDVNRRTPDTVRDRVAEEVNEGFALGTKEVINSIIPTIKNMTSGISSGISYITSGVVGALDSMKSNLSNFTSSISSGFRTATNNITSSVTSIMGSEIMEVVDTIKNVMSGLFSMFKGIFGFIYSGISKLFFGRDKKTESKDENNFERKDDREQVGLLQTNKEQVGLLQTIMNAISGFFGSSKEINENMEEGINSLVVHNKDELKRKARETPEKEEKGIGYFIIGIFSLIIGTIVGYLSKALRPFATLGKLMLPFQKGGMIYNLFGKIIPKKLTFLGRIGKLFSKIIGKIGNVFSNIAKMPGINRIFSIGRVFGAFLFYIRAAWGIFKELRDGSKDLRDRILGISAVITELLLEIPQMILNGLLSLFGSDFRVDFSKEAIIDAVNGITDWVFDNVTKPVLDFFLITLPGIWKSFKSKFFNMVQYFKEIPIRIDNWMKGFINDVGESIKEIFEAIVPKVSGIIENIKNSIQFVFDIITYPFRKFIIDPLMSLVDWFRNTPDHSAVDNMIESIYNIIQRVFDVITWPFRKFIIDPLTRVIEWAQGFLDSDENIGEGIKIVLKSLVAIPKKVFNWVKAPFVKFIEWVSGLFDGDEETSMIDRVKDALSTVFEIPGKILDWITGIIPSWDDIKNFVANKIPKRVARWLGIGGDKDGDEKSDDMTTLDGFDPSIWDKVLESLIGIKDTSIKMLESVIKVPELLISMMDYFRLLFEENMLKNMFTSIVDVAKDTFTTDEHKDITKTGPEKDTFVDGVRRDGHVDLSPKDDEDTQSVYQETILQYLSTIVGLLKSNGKSDKEIGEMFNQTNINSSGGGQGGARNTEGDNPDQVENFGLMMLTSTAVGSDY